ncbi:MAG: MAC/perforin domain-containing protein [Pseudomonadota bacterium]
MEAGLHYRFVTSVALGSLVLGATIVSEAAAQQRTVDEQMADIFTRPSGGNLMGGPPPLAISVFKGCENDNAATGTRGTQAVSPRTRIEEASGSGGASSSGRTFAPVGGSSPVVASPNAQEEDCALRIDGLWVDRIGEAAFDTNFDPGGWVGSQVSELAHGVYTRPRYLMIDKTNNQNAQLVVRQPMLSGRSVTYASNDSARLIDTLKTGRARKQYRAARPSRGFDRNLTVRVLSNGVTVLEMGRRQYVRPRPELSLAERAAQTPMQDAFNRGDTIKALDAMVKGFDVIKQNPNAFDQNDKNRVFVQQKGTNYYTQDQKLVPIDMKLDLINTQGAIQFSNLMSTATEIQSAYASSYGKSTKVGISGTAGRKDQTAGVNLEASVGFGSSFSNSQYSLLSSNNSVSQAVGFSKQKQFALIRDHAQSELDGFFRDDVISAVESGDFSRLIDTYGTHYSYATTYGSRAQLRSTATETGYRNLVGESSSESSSKGANALIVEASTDENKSSQIGTGIERRTQYGSAVFTAVGGNGSWNEQGYSSGATPYPILTDMRPLSELLNPMNFPNRPDVFGQGKRAFERAIERTLIGAARRLETRSLLPEIIPKQRWTLRALSLNCDASGSGEGNLPVIQLKGSMRLDLQYAGRNQSRVVFNVTSKKGYRKITCDGRNHTATDATKYTIEGTADEIGLARWRVRANLDELDSGSPIRAFRVYAQGGLADAAHPDKIFQGSSAWTQFPTLNSPRRRVWEFRTPQSSKQPDLRLRIEFERVE